MPVNCRDQGGPRPLRFGSIHSRVCRRGEGACLIARFSASTCHVLRSKVKIIRLCPAGGKFRLSPVVVCLPSAVESGMAMRPCSLRARRIFGEGREEREGGGGGGRERSKLAEEGESGRLWAEINPR